MKKLTKLVLFIFIISVTLSCTFKREVVSKILSYTDKGFNSDNVISQIPDVTYIQEITKETKENVTGLKLLSDNYVIKNVKKANKFLEDTNKALRKAEKKDKKEAFKIFVEDYKEIVDFYMEITKEKKVIKIKNELLSYYEDTVRFYESLDDMEIQLKNFKDDCSSEISSFDQYELSKEDKLIKTRLEAERKNAETQEKMIKDFKKHYQRLIPEMKKVQEDVDYFIFTLKETSKIYESAYRTVELSMNISNAIDNIQELTSLNDLTAEVMKSWENLDGILENLSDISNFIE